MAVFALEWAASAASRDVFVDFGAHGVGCAALACGGVGTVAGVLAWQCGEGFVYGLSADRAVGFFCEDSCAECPAGVAVAVGGVVVAGHSVRLFLGSVVGLVGSIA